MPLDLGLDVGLLLPVPVLSFIAGTPATRPAVAVLRRVRGRLRAP